METQCLKIRIKPGKTDTVVNWMRALATRKDDIRISLERETMVVESVFLDRQPHGDFLIFYTRAENLAKANAILIQSPTDLDRDALALIQDTWEDVKPLEILFDFDRIEKVESSGSSIPQE